MLYKLTDFFGWHIVYLFHKLRFLFAKVVLFVDL
nr:MAG TPA: hypothetical protein [Caudoviricetes sp.]